MPHLILDNLFAQEMPPASNILDITHLLTKFESIHEVQTSGEMLTGSGQYNGSAVWVLIEAMEAFLELSF